ncbi:MAG: 50S ribosomal protein L18 [bacterium]|nr:50S ribosomal protein L18 [bacterium]
MRNYNKEKNKKKIRRANRVRAKIFGTAKRPRVSIKRSLRHLHVQVIDDDKANTIIATSDIELKGKQGKGVDIAKQIGLLTAKKVLDKKIKQVVFDRKGYKYHGRVKALADGMREGGLEF